MLKDTKHGKVVPPKSSYEDEFPEELKNHGAYLGKDTAAHAGWGSSEVWGATPVSLLVPGYSVGSLISSDGSQLYTAGAPRFNHTGKVIVFTLKNSGNLTVLKALLGEQVPHPKIRFGPAGVLMSSFAY